MDTQANNGGSEISKRKNKKHDICALVGGELKPSDSKVSGEGSEERYNSL